MSALRAEAYDSKRRHRGRAVIELRERGLTCVRHVCCTGECNAVYL